ncbi:hypothetical protein WJX73_003854 [Symbiochloris irregularis]|uniref:PHD-type domain-containing protein n=1 Tax=Symbiochloris irregularis TaxID=706552 RepID=A0AAW1NKA9_9CHLO
MKASKPVFIAGSQLPGSGRCTLQATEVLDYDTLKNGGDIDEDEEEEFETRRVSRGTGVWLTDGDDSKPPQLAVVEQVFLDCDSQDVMLKVVQLQRVCLLPPDERTSLSVKFDDHEVLWGREDEVLPEHVLHPCRVWFQDQGDKMPTMLAGKPPKEYERIRPGFSCKFHYNRDTSKLSRLRDAFTSDSRMGAEVQAAGIKRRAPEEPPAKHPEKRAVPPSGAGTQPSLSGQTRPQSQKRFTNWDSIVSNIQVLKTAAASGTIDASARDSWQVVRVASAICNCPLDVRSRLAELQLYEVLGAWLVRSMPAQGQPASEQEHVVSTLMAALHRLPPTPSTAAWATRSGTAAVVDTLAEGKLKDTARSLQAFWWMPGSKQVSGFYDVRAGTVFTAAAAGEGRSLQAFISQLKGKRIPASPASVIMVTADEQHRTLSDWLSESCDVCKLPTDESRMILCDECSHLFHLYCLNPALTEVPQGDWYCSRCTANREADLDGDEDRESTGAGNQ